MVALHRPRHSCPLYLVWHPLPPIYSSRGPLTLTPGVSQEVLIGGPDYGGTLADLIAQPTYYIGASLSGGVLASAQERIELTNGKISVYY